MDNGHIRDTARVVSTAAAAHTRLPFNRKERYFTGTVLPMIVACEGFAHLGRFLGMCGLGHVHETPGGWGQDLQFFTEYSFKNAVFTKEDKDRFRGMPSKEYVPDVVLTGPDWILAVEAKMYHYPNQAKINNQVASQGRLIRYWAGAFDIPESRIGHVALLPNVLSTATGVLDIPTITWEQVADEFRDVAPPYWTAVLDFANGSRLVNTASNTSGKNADAKITGAEIVSEYPRGTLVHPAKGPYLSMGRQGGLNGPALANDLATGKWATQAYEIRVSTEPRKNWFPIESFVQLVGNLGR